MDKKKIIIITIILILAAGNIILATRCYLGYREIQQARKAVEEQRLNTKIINFLQVFIIKVLKAEKEVSFEDRLKLENTVRDLNNAEVLSQWEKFTSSKTEEIAQEEVKNLLDLLVRKMSY
jgi:hypothetical protein